VQCLALISLMSQALKQFTDLQLDLEQQWLCTLVKLQAADSWCSRALWDVVYVALRFCMVMVIVPRFP
jgi:hypothetical protein